ncbi:hypothetical protein SAMN06265171_101416 [Chryseobacterium rhizoplanae]|uniref:Uncharacterized protein n=1 Tax=Chryseobacterium rhizoplanae TaxID=1609531 RepID=A0A521AU45_9FLAO|nr:hypothetical protein [Chryseobacterium rhizoplanae]SMO38327.1 hypothetical protein SAMN06265171_101416 [Chryseobacterium rhizoplanae]
MLKSSGLAAFNPLKEVYLLASPSFFTVAGVGVQEAIASFKINEFFFYLIIKYNLFKNE